MLVDQSSLPPRVTAPNLKKAYCYGKRRGGSDKVLLLKEQTCFLILTFGGVARWEVRGVGPGEMGVKDWPSWGPPDFLIDAKLLFLFRNHG